MAWRPTFLTRRVEQRLGSIAVLSSRHPARTLAALAAVCAACLVFAGKLPINADLADLLPESFQSVQDLEIVKKRFGGIGYVAVVGMEAEPDVLRQFADDLVPKLEALDTVRYVEYTRPVAFFEDRILYFLDTQDLQIVEERVAARYAWERRSRNPLYLDLEEEEPPSLDFSDIQARYARRSDQIWMRNQIGERYYIDPQKRIILLLVKPTSASFDLDFAQQVVGDVKRTTEALVRSDAYADLVVGYTGRYTRRIDQHNLLQSDLRWVSMLALLLMLVYLVAHFRRVLAMVLIMVPLVVGLLWTYGFAAATFGMLNILTAFIGAILLGLGVDHGIHLLGRYAAECTTGRSHEDAIRAAFGNTGRAVTVAAVTTAVGFAGLGLSEFRAFNEFGVVAAGGTVLVVIAYVTCMPALLGLATRFGWRPHKPADPTASPHAVRLPGMARPIFIATAAILALIVLQMPRARFDYNFSALEAHDLESYRLDGPTNELLGYSQSPVVVLTSGLEEERQIAAAMRKRQEALGDQTTIDFVVASADLIPLHQEEKQPILASLHELAMKIKPRQLDPEYRRYLVDLRRMTRVPPFGRDNLPPEVRRQFKGVEGTEDYGFVLAFPSVSLTDGANVWRFAKEVRDVPLADGRRISAAGENMILADIFDMVTSEAPPVLTLTLVLIFATLALLLVHLRRAIICLATGLGTLFVTLGLLPLVGLELNYLNIVMIPVLFGIAVDGAAHLVTRVSGGYAVTDAVGETGRAISGAILTTGLGFGSLMLADHPGLNSLGALAALGLAVNAIITLVLLPAFLAFRPLERDRPL